MYYLLVAIIFLSVSGLEAQQERSSTRVRTPTRTYSSDTYYDDKPGEPPRGKATRGRTRIEYEERSSDLPGQPRKGRAYREGTKIKYR